MGDQPRSDVSDGKAYQFRDVSPMHEQKMGDRMRLSSFCRKTRKQLLQNGKQDHGLGKKGGRA
jgi:hypothetical protein